MLRSAAAVLLAGALVGACGGKSSSGPAWPKSAGRVEGDPEKDGGQSLEPQQAAHVAAIERAEDKTPTVDESAVVVETPAPPKVEVIEIRPVDIVNDR